MYQVIVAISSSVMDSVTGAMFRIQLLYAQRSDSLHGARQHVGAV